MFFQDNMKVMHTLIHCNMQSGFCFNKMSLLSYYYILEIAACNALKSDRVLGDSVITVIESNSDK